MILVIIRLGIIFVTNNVFKLAFFNYTFKDSPTTYN